MIRRTYRSSSTQFSLPHGTTNPSARSLSLPPSRSFGGGIRVRTPFEPPTGNTAFSTRSPELCPRVGDDHTRHAKMTNPVGNHHFGRLRTRENLSHHRHHHRVPAERINREHKAVVRVPVVFHLGDHELVQGHNVRWGIMNWSGATMSPAAVGTGIPLRRTDKSRNGRLRAWQT